MRVRSLVLLLLFVSMVALFRAERTSAQAPARQSTPAAPPAPALQAHATLAQVMRATLYFNSNVVFLAQDQDPGTEKLDPDPTMQTKSTSPPTSIFGGWQAVENSSMALSEAANLLMVPGRLCSNGRAVPVQDADWVKFVQGLREAGLAAYKAAQTKKQDAMVDVSEQVSNACNNCHRVYRRPVCGSDPKGK